MWRLWHCYWCRQLRGGWNAPSMTVKELTPPESIVSSMIFTC